MKRNTLKAVTAWILFALSIALITPTTLAYIPASTYLFMGIPEAPSLALFIPLSGYGIYCSWCITLNMDEYTQYGAPFHIYMGIAAGTIALFIITKIFGTPKSIENIVEHPLSAIIIGFGPLISSYTSLLVIFLTRRTVINHSEQV